MTIMDFTSAIDAYRKLRESGLSLEIVIKRLFAADTGRMELIKAVETVEQFSPSESRKIVTKVLSN
jgi:DMSO reductase anchor subunit